MTPRLPPLPPDTWPDGPDDVLATYQAVGPAWVASRDRSLFERPWLDRLMAAASTQRPPKTALDIGCGSGAPIATYLAQCGLQVTGLDGAPAQIAQFRATVPGAPAYLADMRAFDLGRSFDILVSFNAFFHLSPTDQPRAIACFAQHAAPGAALLLTTGPDHSERIGAVAGRPIYHASLSPAAYRTLFAQHGFDELAFTPQDPTCRGHSLWLLRKT